MYEDNKTEKINAFNVITAVNTTLRSIDERLVNHGERVAFIANKICDTGNISLDRKTLFLLCAFHDIGAYKTDEIDRMLEFETHNVWGHSIYGYLFLKYMTPLNKHAKAVLYHHSSWSTIANLDSEYRDYAAMINLADRIDVAFTYCHDNDNLYEHINNTKIFFKKDYVDIALQCIKNNQLISKLSNESYTTENNKIYSQFSHTQKDAFEYLKMIVYSIDFRSEHTVTHTINTVSIAINIAKHFNLPESEINDIYLGALLHDVGKIAIPTSILEYPGKLNDEKMKIMRTHVAETKKLIEDLVPDKICELSLRHHEKLDGSGYPLGLTAAELTFSQRIIAVADIVSALSSRRSYKEPFPKGKTIAILTELSHDKLDSDICNYVIFNYDNIMDSTEPERLNIIEKYKQIITEFNKLKEQFTNQNSK